jgi:DNA primase
MRYCSGMSPDLTVLAAEYHRNLPERIRAYLHARGIPDEIIELHHLGWNDRRITIPIFNRDGVPVCFKFAKDPEDHSSAPKMLTSRGGRVELYGWERVLAKPCRLIICEGEFDRLVLEAHGFAAVTSIGGAGAFREEWAADLLSIPELYLCFDHDDAGRQGALRVGQFLPHAKVVALPDEMSAGGDVSDFFVRLGRTREDFLHLLQSATPVPVPPATLPSTAALGWSRSFGELSGRIATVKEAVPIAELVSQYVALKPSGRALRGICPFHEDHYPSLMVYPEAGTFRCYGCGRHGDVITFVITIEHLPFFRALDRLEEFRDNYDRDARDAA